MRQLPVYLIIVILLASSFQPVFTDNNNTGINDDDIIALTITQSFPILNMECKEVGRQCQEQQIFYYRDLVMIELLLYSSVFRNDEPIKTDTIKSYFVHSLSKPYGFEYLPGDSSLVKKHSVDSLFKSWLIMDINRVFKDTSLSFKQGLSNDSPDTTRILYHIRDKKDSTRTGRCLLSFSRKPFSSPFSMSPALDSLHGPKLVKANLFSDPWYMKDKNLTVDAIEISYELGESLMPKDFHGLTYFKRALQQYKSEP